MTANAKTFAPVAAEAIISKGWFGAYKYLILRRISQIVVLGLFLVGPWFGLWIVKGNLVSSLTLDTLPLTDPYVLLQTIASRHWPELTAIVGALIVAGAYTTLGGRLYCSWVCPINPVTDAAHWLHMRLDLNKGWQPKRETRLYVLATTFVVSAITGTVAFEFVNPVSMLHRGLIFGMGFAWTFVVAVFLFDLFVARRGWCGHLCPVGAFYGLLNAPSLLRVSAVNRASCDDCMDCFAVCPEMHVITPALRGTGDDTPLITARDCTTCGRCIDVCSQNVFRFTHRFDERIGAGLKTDAGTENRHVA
ncbi:MAG: quinol dehydrogenase ferredoxin subunit NapH [Rhodobiaceae bacterium]|nr:quinol dehydrogenase ferredoxin subunit NapH [Rhodobiaceae bacterium]